MEILIAIFSIFITWLLTHWYYRKSLNSQKREFEDYIKPLMFELERLSDSHALSMNTSALLLRDKRINDAISEYRKKGTPKFIIDTYDDYDDEQKADMYDTVLMRAKGRKGKNNPYRK